jgi:hypothetical protein
MNMKMNKWTMALAAAGVVSLSSVAQAQEAAAGANALAASTTLSGYVSTSYTLDTTTSNDGSALDVVDLKFASAQGAGEYATGYTVELWVGPNASNLGTDSTGGTVELYQANIDLRLPVGNGLDLKVGQFTTVVGAETNNYNENAFYTRSRAFDSDQPTHHTGVLASYQVSDDASLSIGFVNDTTSNVTNTDSGGTAYLVGLSYTLPDSTGFLGGTELTYARVDGAGADGSEQDNSYLGASIPLPVEGLSYTLAWDNVEYATGADTTLVGHYLSYAANDKMTVNLRYETGNVNGATNNNDGVSDISIGIDYQLWENVISRVEYIEASDDGGTGTRDNKESLVFNVIYSF